MTEKIGDALKAVRLQAGLTQQEMCDGVCSVSAYSKIERGIHKIDIDTLAQILDNTLGIINSNAFFEAVLNETPTQKEGSIIENISRAVLLKDKDKLKAIKQKVIQENNLTELTNELLNCGEGILSGSHLKKSYPTLQKRIQILERMNNWEGLVIFELNLMLPFLSKEKDKKFIKKIYHSLKKNPDKIFDLKFVFEFSALLINYLTILLNSNAPNEDFTLPLDIIFELTSPLYSDELFGYGMVAQKVKAIITSDKEVYSDIIRIQKVIGRVPESESARLEDNKYFRQRSGK